MSPISSLPENFSLGYVFGECLICHEPIGSGLICSTCAPKPDNPKGTQKAITPSEVRLFNMSKSSYGYIKPSEIFIASSIYYIFVDAFVRHRPDSEYSVFVRRSTSGEFFLGLNTLSQDLGHFQFGSNRSYVPARIESAYSTPIKTVTIRDMQDGDEGWTEPYALFELEGQLCVIASAQLSGDKDLYKTMKIRKRNGIYEVDQKTIDTDDIWSGWPGQEDELQYVNARLVWF